MENNNLSLTNYWRKSDLSKNIITLDELALKYEIADVDFLKIDTDGSEYQVLMSAKDTIFQSPVLGILIEVNFIGSTDSQNSFHTIDKLLRSWGFELYDLTTRNYSSKVLPSSFVDHCIAQSIYGKIMQGDALYLRDPASKYQNNAPICPTLSVDKLLKLACLYEIFSLPDCAAEILIEYRNQFETFINVDYYLDLLTQEVTNRKISYSEYIKSVSADQLLPDGIYGRNFNIENEYSKILSKGASISKKLLSDNQILEDNFFNWRMSFHNPTLDQFRFLAHAAFNLDSLEQQYDFVKKFDKNFLKNYLAAENKVFKNYFLNLWECAHGETVLESYPWNVAIPIADICNARCTFCNSWLGGVGVTSVNDLNVFEEPIKHARIITLQGHGEPLVNPQIDNILEKIKNWSSNQCRTSIITNGVKLKEKLNLLLEANVQVFNISLNAATAETHDIVMGLGLDAFDKIIDEVKTIVNLKKENKNLQVTLSLVMNKDNLHEIVDFIDLAHTLNVDKIYIRSLLNCPDSPSQDISELTNIRDGLPIPAGLNYHLLSPTLHPECDLLLDNILKRINNSTIEIEYQPETWKTQLFGNNVQKMIEDRWNEIKFISREEAIADKDVRSFYKKTMKKVSGKGNYVEEVDHNSSYNPYNRKPKFDCKFVYHNLMSFESNLRLSPCCYMLDVPGYEPMIMKDNDFMGYWNSPAMVKLRDSLIRGPMFESCKTCPTQG